ncbi:uncharacterized protein LOC127858296 [Dreissena polymorpha]|uniref:Uncharacterized protein n=1 Tax=Dreissena polymorpha TaxID=45954 RepID=A0A9D4BVV6_DREPO|nr:uncharacterized protein LOC127858296 [Dreissena polymorpha]XP_052251260.1 uncharacterized protein LOC127858296 [Dreissena polymorpha]XP_052251261.1 uncharacterized protein LOC127858296 [Dreissena polymorpha]KAH3711875.1 hypothetical protein DPMN_071550 [Dreissena polymorpha]
MEFRRSSPALGARAEEGHDDVINVATPVAKLRLRSRNDSGYTSASSTTASPFTSNSSPCMFKFEDLPQDVFDVDHQQVLGASFTEYSTPVFHGGDSACDLSEKLVDVRLNNTDDFDRIRDVTSVNVDHEEQMDTGLDAEVVRITTDTFKGPVTPPVDMPRPSAPFPYVLETQDQFEPIEDEEPVDMVTDLDPIGFVSRQRSASLPEVTTDFIRQQEVGRELRLYADEFNHQHDRYHRRRALSVQIPVAVLGLQVQIVAESSPLYDISGWPNLREVLAQHSRYTQTDRDVD